MRWRSTRRHRGSLPSSALVTAPANSGSSATSERDVLQHLDHPGGRIRPTRASASGDGREPAPEHLGDKVFLEEK